MVFSRFPLAQNTPLVLVSRLVCSDHPTDTSIQTSVLSQHATPRPAAHPPAVARLVGTLTVSQPLEGVSPPELVYMYIAPREHVPQYVAPPRPIRKQL